MTNETNTRTKANAVFFAAIMVVSMVAVGFAAAPAAAAASNVTANNVDLADGNNIDVTADVAETDTDASLIIAPSSAKYNETNHYTEQTSDTTDENVSFSGAFSDASEGESYTAYVLADDSGAGLPSDGASLKSWADDSDTFDVTDSSYSGDEDYDRTIENGQTVFQGQVILVDVSDVSGSVSNLELRKVGDDQTVGGSPVALDPEDGYVVIDTSNRDIDQWVITTQSRGQDIATNDVQFEIVAQDLSTEFDGDTVSDAGSDSEIEYEISSDARNVYAVNVEADGLDDEDLQNIFTNSDAFTNDVTDDLGAGDGDYDRYNVTSYDASASDYAVNSEDEYITLFRSEGTHELNFTDIEADDYEFEASVVDSTGEDTDSITVQDIGDGEVNIEQGSLTQQQGDVVEFNVTADGATNAGTVVIGGEDDFGYQANVSITDFGDDDQITLAFNTYTAGGLAGTTDDFVTIVDADDDDNIEVTGETDDLNGILSSGDYDISSSAASSGTDDENAAETLENSDDIATLFIEERSTESVQVWTTSDSAADDVLTADDPLAEITNAVESGAVTQTDTVAYNDVSVHQISASGLAGALDYAGQVDDTDSASEQLAFLVENTENDLNSDSAVQFRVRETRASAGPNAPRRTVNLMNTDFDVVADDENDDYYVVLDTNAIEFDDETSIANDEDVEFEVDFTVRDERLANLEDDADSEDLEESYETVSTNFNVNERSADFDEDPYNVSNTDSETVTGTSNVAPGTEFTVRSRSASGTQPSFVKTNDEVTVNANGSWEAEFDFSGQSVGDEYTFRVQQLGLNDAVEVDGTVVEQVEEPDDDSTDDDSTDDDSTDDDSTDDDSTDDDSTDDDSTDDDSSGDDSTTEDGTPGFGAIVALVALIAAALLATRRNE